MDRTKTGTKALFGGMMKYDLNHTFPLLTHKKVFWRGVAEELLWFIKGSTDANELQKKNINIWAGNSSKEYLNSIGIDRQAGDLGPVYGFQWRYWNAPYIDKDTNYKGQGVDQLSQIINDIKSNASSRRLIMTAWNPSQLKQMALPPVIPRLFSAIFCAIFRSLIVTS